MEFLPLIETLDAHDASLRRLFGGEGIHLGRDRSHAGDYADKLERTEGLLAEAFGSGRSALRASMRLKEALGTSDFPLLFGDALDRQLLAKYQATTPSWRAFVKYNTTRDFRTFKRFAMDGSEGVLDTVDQQQEYPASSLSETRYTGAISKYGRRIPFAWETMINDDLDALKDIPERFAKAAQRTESKLVTQAYVDTSGPHASLYTTGNKNKVVTGNGAASSNPVLSTSGLQSAMIVLANMLDADGEPIVVDGITLVVPPALEVTAENLLNATQLWLQTEGGGQSGTHVNAINWMSRRVKMVVDPYIPIVASSANGATSWFLFADPNVSRPALEIDFLRGYEQPQLFLKSPNAQRVGGGPVDPMDGDFDTDSMQWKIRHCLTVVRLDPKASVASNGSGS